MAEFQYYQAEEKVNPQQETQAATPAAPPNALQFFDDAQAGAQAWTGVADVAMEAGSVAVDIMSKLGEAEHQNKADAFYLEYSQEVQKLRDNINSGEAKSKIHDLDDVKGVTSYYQDEETKIYTDLSQKYNKDNYKRRDSLMRDRKAQTFLNSMSSVRQNKIQQISKNSADSFDIYLKASTQESAEAYLGGVVAKHKYRDIEEQTQKLRNLDKQFEEGKISKEKYTEQLVKFREVVEEGENNENLANESDKVLEEIKIKTENEAKKRYYSGIISEAKYKDIHNEVARNVQGMSAYKLAYQDHGMFLEILEKNPEAFGMVDQKYLTQLKTGALKRQLADENDLKKKKSNEAEGKFWGEFADSMYEEEDLIALEAKLKNSENYADWDNETSRNKARMSIKRGIKDLTTGKDGTASKQAVRSAIDNMFQSAQKGQPLDPLPEWNYNIDVIYSKTPDVGELVKAEVKMAQKGLTIFKSVRMGSFGHAEGMQKLSELRPQDSESPTFGVRQQTWERVDGMMRRYDQDKREDFVRVTREEMGNKEDSNLQNVKGAQESAQALLDNTFDVEEVVRRGLTYNGNEGQIGRIRKDKNLQAMSNVSVVSKAQANLFRQIPWKQRNQLVRDIYGDYAVMAFKDLKRAGIHKSWNGYGQFLSPRAEMLHTAAETNQEVKGYIPPQDTINVTTAFMEKIGSGIETQMVRDEVKDLFTKYVSQQRSNGDLRSYSELADEFFEGIELVEMPNHSSDHLQKHVWMGRKEFAMFGVDGEDFSDGAMSILLQFSKEDLDNDDLFIMGAQDVNPAHLIKLSDEELSFYPEVRQLVDDVFNKIVQANSVTNNRNNPVFTLVRSPDGERFNLALKNHPIGGIFRIGKSDAEGNLKVVEFTKEEIFEHASMYNQRAEGYRLLTGKVSGLGQALGMESNPLDQVSDDLSNKEIVTVLRANTDNSTPRGKAMNSLLNKIEKDIEENPQSDETSSKKDIEARVEKLIPNLKPNTKPIFWQKIKEWVADPMSLFK